MQLFKIWLPLIFLILITPFTPFLDLYISHFFYALGNGVFVSNPFTKFVFSYGFYPANSLAFLAFLILLGSIWQKNWRQWHKPALMILSSLLIGAGLITHVILKDHWGRPRPKQVEVFGGAQPFRPYYLPHFFDQPEPSKSFPCGHCSTGFFFFALALIGKRLHNKKIAIAGWVLAFGLGAILSGVRIAQGGHFFSDTLVSAVIMWETALFFDWLIFRNWRLN